MILSYMYLIRTGHQTAQAKQRTAKAAKHHYKRAKWARGKGGSAEGANLFRAIEPRRGSKPAERRDGAAGAGGYAPGRRGACLMGALYT